MVSEKSSKNIFKLCLMLFIYIELGLLLLLSGKLLFDYSQIIINKSLNNCKVDETRFYSTTLFGIPFELPVMNLTTNHGPIYFCKINPESDKSDIRRLAEQIKNTFFVSTFFAGVLTVLFWNISIPDSKTKRSVRYIVFGAIILTIFLYNLAVISGLIYNASKM